MINSLQEHLQSQKPVAAVFTPAIDITTRVVKSLNEAIRQGKDPFLWSLVEVLCSISGVLFQLRQEVQDAIPKSSWLKTTWTLCASSGPLETFMAKMEILRSEFTLDVDSRVMGDPVGPSAEKIDITEIRLSVEKQRDVFFSALQNDHVYVFYFCSQILR